MKKILSSYVILTMVFSTVAFLPMTATAENDHNDGNNSHISDEHGHDGDHGDSEHGDDHDHSDNQDDHQDNHDDHADNDHGTEDSSTPTVPPVTTATLIATKVVCDSETDLPNLGNGASVTASTATDFVAAHPNCHVQAGWDFQWAPEGTENPGSNMTVAAGNPWTTFGHTLADGTATTLIPAGSMVWVREVMQDGFVLFSDNIGENLPENPTSAEMYCATDGVNYDNYEWVKPVEAGQTYHCVAFNAVITVTPPVTETDACTNIEGLQASVPEGMTASDGVCTTPSSGGNPSDTPADVCPNIDGNQDALPEGKVLTDGNCVDAPAAPQQESAPSGNGGSNPGGSGAPSNGPIVGALPGGSAGGQVLGESCGIYLNSYLKFGRNNDTEEVTKLQTFLNEYLKLNLPVTGIFDEATFDAVKVFQLKENDEVLSPWAKLGLLKTGEATGYVFKTTKRRINLIKCAELSIPMPNLLSN